MILERKHIESSLRAHSTWVEGQTKRSRYKQADRHRAANIAQGCVAILQQLDGTKKLDRWLDRPVFVSADKRSTQTTTRRRQLANVRDDWHKNSAQNGVTALLRFAESSLAASTWVAQLDANVMPISGNVAKGRAEIAFS